MDYGVYNYNTEETVDATDTGWGDASGPFHTGNPGGTGDPVSDYVSYEPPLAERYEECPVDEEPTPAPPAAVGGTVYPVNKAVLLAPWIALAATIIAGASLVLRRSRAHR